MFPALNLVEKEGNVPTMEALRSNSSWLADHCVFRCALRKGLSAYSRRHLEVREMEKLDWNQTLGQLYTIIMPMSFSSITFRVKFTCCNAAFYNACAMHGDLLLKHSY